jgi:hypothetical protein
MTGTRVIITQAAPATSLISWPLPAQDTPRVGSARAHELTAQCTRCGAVGTHYLTCPSLRLPAGHRLHEDLDPEGADHRGERRGIDQASRISGGYRDSQPGGPDHPDWPHRPRH